MARNKQATGFRVWLAATAAVLAVAACSPGETPAQPAGESHAQTAEALGLPTAPATSLGFSDDGVEAIRTEFRGLVDQKKLAGVTTLLSRHGEVAYFDTYGAANATTGEALQPDSIFRIASMTKPIAGVAMMQLWEQGKWKLDDPVSKYIPEFADLQVKTADGGTEPQASPMTMAQLMSHTAGFGVSAVYANDGLQDTDLQGMIDKLAQLPLETQPGTAWDYGPSVNIQGYIVEKLSGQTLDAYLQDHIFAPLGMTDTGFWVPEDKAQLVVAIHTYNENGEIVALPESPTRTSPPSFLSGSGGLYSTAKDYWRFAQAVLNGGSLDGATVLKPETVEVMRTNVLAPGVKVDLYGPDMEGIGFGLDFAIVMDPAAADTPQGLNTFYWGGAFGTWFWIDPTNDVVFVGMIQNLDGSRPDKGTPATRVISPRLVYSALTDPAK
ncbi:MAG: serine hydrolase domain-containing protein [Hyphomonadaceae bacterium]